MANNEFNGTIICSLCLLRQSGEVLLARKTKRGTLVAGQWNGYGGKQELSESIRTTATREVFEETGGGIVVFPGALDRRAVIYFHNHDGDGQEPFVVKVHIFEARRWEGRAWATDEMTTPTWFAENKLPWGEMPAGDHYWLIPVLAGQCVIGHIQYGPKQKNLLGEPDIQIVDNLDELEPED